MTPLGPSLGPDNTSLDTLSWYGKCKIYEHVCKLDHSPAWSIEKKCGKYFTQYHSRSKEGDNPEKKWDFGNSAISALEYSPCGRRLAVASRKGSCYVLANQEMDDTITFNFLVEMNSYFGGFLCCSWSPSGRFLAAGGEDDLISVMNIENGRIICRCQGIVFV